MAKLVFSVVCILIHMELMFVEGVPETGLIRQLLQKNYHQCVQECDNVKNCASAKHIRLSALCILYSHGDDKTSGAGPGITIYTKPGITSRTEQCGSGEDCQDYCEDPEPMFGTEILGNMVSVGAKVRYQCIDGSKSAISECLSNGTWSFKNLTCNCSEPTNVRSTNGWIYNKTAKNKNKKEIIFCNGTLSVICQAETGIWYNLSNCCNPCKYPFHLNDKADDCHTFGGSCFYFSREKRNWEEAMKDCENRGGYLAEVYCNETNAFLAKFISGTMTYGTIKKGEGPFSVYFDGPTQKTEKQAHEILDRFVQLGGNFLDTADFYAAGNSQRVIGTWLQKQTRDNIVIATKARHPVSDADAANPNGLGLSRRHIIKACEDSLARLQTDYTDLYQAHMWDDGTPVEETLRTFDDLIRCGKIRYFGYSNVCGWQMQKIAETTESLGLSRCISLQQQYNLMTRESEKEEFRVCANEGVDVLPWSPLQGGMLTGKYKRNKEPEALSRAAIVDKLHKEGKTPFGMLDEVARNDQYWNLIVIMEKIAKKHGKTVAQVALRWLLQQKIVASVIIGASSVKQLEDNMGAASGWEFSAEEIKELNEASSKPETYPYNMIAAYQIGRTNPFIR